MRIKLTFTANDLLTAWRCVKMVIENEIPQNSSDIGLLMQGMGSLAKAKDDLENSQSLAPSPEEIDVDSPEIPKEEHEFFLSEEEAEATWHSAKIVLDNKLYPDPLEVPDEMKKIIAVFEKLGDALDQHKKRKGKLDLVDPSS